MRGDRVFRDHSPQIRLGLLKNRTVFAVWLLILAGALTAAEPFMQFSRTTSERLAPGCTASSIIRRLSASLNLRR